MDPFIRVEEATRYLRALPEQDFGLAVSVACGAAEVLLGADPELSDYYFRSGKGLPRCPFDSYAFAIWVAEILRHASGLKADSRQDYTVRKLSTHPWCVHVQEAERFIGALPAARRSVAYVAYCLGVDAVARMAEPPHCMDVFLGLRLACSVLENMDRWTAIMGGEVDPNWPEDMWQEYVAKWKAGR